MINRYFSLFVLAFSFFSLSQEIHHELSMPNPETHYFHIKTTLTDFKEKNITITLPVWTPGSYLIREYPKNVNLLRAKDENGKSLNVNKISKNQWKIEKGSSKKVIINYEYYAFELTVRTSFLDKTHGFANGVNIFTYPEGYKSLGGKLTIIPHPSFKKISIPLLMERDGFSSDDNKKTFIFSDFDELADSPIEIGNQEIFSFDAAGVKHYVSMYGPGNYNVERLKIDMAKIVEAATAVFGKNPNEEYWFIIHNTDGGGGGLEHKNSTTLGVDRWGYTYSKYKGFLSLVAHEYFHVWNVKRLRPAELIDYDYSRENFTDLLWIMEGFTSYYDKLLLLRAGFYTKNEYISSLQSVINWVEGTIGNKIQPVSDASFDAWIKAYNPNENSSNTTVSYYSKGGILASIFDAMIIHKSKGKQSLDDLMRKLYEDFYEKNNIGITGDSFKKTLETFVGKNLDSFFDKYVTGTETIPYKEFFEPIGVIFKEYELQRNSIGIDVADKNGNLVITKIQAGSSGEQAGLSVNDEIIALNGFRVNKRDFDQLTELMPKGEKFNLIISRDKQLMSIEVEMEVSIIKRYEISYEANKLGDYWLRGQN